MPEPAEQVKVILNETRSGSIVQRRGERKGSQRKTKEVIEN